MDAARKNPQVVGAAPFVAAQALLARGEDMKGALVRGIEPRLEAEVTDIAAPRRRARWRALVPGEFGIVLGGDLARSLYVREGDTVTLIAPGGQVTPAGVVPRLKQFNGGGHLRFGPLRIRLGAGHDPRGGRGEACSGWKARAASA